VAPNPQYLYHSVSTYGAKPGEAGWWIFSLYS